MIFGVSRWNEHDSENMSNGVICIIERNRLTKKRGTLSSTSSLGTHTLHFMMQYGVEWGEAVTYLLNTC